MPIPFESALNFAKEKRPISHAKWIEEIRSIFLEVALTDNG